MNKYSKIHTVYLRDPENKYKTLLEGQFACAEFDYLKDDKWIFTEKIDGTNIRVIWDEQIVRFAGRTDKAQMPTFLYDRLQQMFPMQLFVDAEMPPYCLYGEGYGARIQKGGGNYISNGVDFILFDVKVGDVWLERENVHDIADKLGVQAVPIIGRGKLADAVQVAKQGFLSQIAENKDHIAEGLVMRPEIELLNRMGHRIISKIKYKDFPR